MLKSKLIKQNITSNFYFVIGIQDIFKEYVFKKKYIYQNWINLLVYQQFIKKKIKQLKC